MISTYRQELLSENLLFQTGKIEKLDHHYRVTPSVSERKEYIDLSFLLSQYRSFEVKTIFDNYTSVTLKKIKPFATFPFTLEIQGNCLPNFKENPE